MKLEKEIINACETELDQITLAKQQATDTMNG